MILYSDLSVGIVTDISVTTYGGSVITVVDSVAPVVTAPIDLAIQFANGDGGLAHSALTNWLSSASAVDTKDGAVAVSNNLNTLTDPLPADAHTITFSATDASGNTSTKTVTVTVSEAAANAPILVYGDDITISVEVL